MQRAGKNIDELLESLDSRFHRLRQTGIDEELYGVITSWEASTMDERRPAPSPPM